MANLKKQADSLGLTKLPKYTFYCQPKGIKKKFSTTKPRFIYSIEDYLKGLDQSVQEGDSGSARTVKSHILAPQAGLFLETISKIAGFSAMSADNYVSEINIYTENTDLVKNIVKILNNQWEDGIIPHIDFNKIQKKFGVKRDDVINAWNSFLQ
ncbi:MAG: hypothetical protein KGD58_05970 [Candidatus Lokiarchaeota archaeon]|nr:hypothetical protein [Candidatus Lokiarchaeota archaeon]